MLVGECFAMLVLVGCTIHMELDQSYTFAAVVLALLSVFLFYFVREPVIKDHVLKTNKAIQEKDDNAADNNAADNNAADNNATDNLEETTATMTKCEKIKYLTSAVIDLLKSDLKYTLCFIAWMSTSLIQILYAIYLMLWVTEFVHTGVLDNNEEAKTIYKNTMTIAMASAAVLLPVFGWIIDVVPSRIIFPIAFLLRSVLVSQFYFIKDPRSVYC